MIFLTSTMKLSLMVPSLFIVFKFFIVFTSVLVSDMTFSIGADVMIVSYIWTRVVVRLVVSPVIMSIIDYSVFHIAVAKISQTLFNFKSSTWSEEASSLTVMIASVVINSRKVAIASIYITWVNHLQWIAVSQRHTFLWTLHVAFWIDFIIKRNFNVIELVQFFKVIFFFSISSRMSLICFFVPCIIPSSIFVKISVIEIVSKLSINSDTILVIKVSVTSKMIEIPITILWC